MMDDLEDVKFGSWETWAFGNWMKVEIELVFQSKLSRIWCQTNLPTYAFSFPHGASGLTAFHIACVFLSLCLCWHLYWLTCPPWLPPVPNLSLSPYWEPSALRLGPQRAFSSLNHYRILYLKHTVLDIYFWTRFYLFVFIAHLCY